MSEDLSEMWDYGAGLTPTCVEPIHRRALQPRQVFRPHVSVPRLESGQWAPLLAGNDRSNGNGNALSNGNGNALSNGNGNAPSNGNGNALSNGNGNGIALSNGNGNAPSNGSASGQEVGQSLLNGNGLRSGNGQLRSKIVNGGGIADVARNREVEQAPWPERSPVSEIGQKADVVPKLSRLTGQGRNEIAGNGFVSHGGIDPVNWITPGDSMGTLARSDFGQADEVNRPVGRGLMDNAPDQRYESGRALRTQGTDRASEPTRQVTPEEQNRSRTVIEWAAVLIGSVLIALLVQRVFVQAFWIPSGSMENTLAIDDKVFVDKLSYRVKDIRRGDIVVFHKTDNEIDNSLEDDPKDIIKRVIGLSGETVLIQNNEVMLDGKLLVEPYLEADALTSDFGPFVVPEGHLFVMGDNREHSADSRFGLGPVDEDRVVGRAFVTFWPPTRLGGL